MLKAPYAAKTAWMVATLVGVVVVTGCGMASISDSRISTQATDIDFAKAYALAKSLFDVSQTLDITDEQLLAMYKTDANEVVVRSTVFPGDTTPSRYMFVKDNATQTQTIYLSGTNSETLWSFDLDLTVINNPDFRSHIHRGFDNATLTVLDDVLPRLEITYPVTVTGYSLGGAMAALAGEYLIIDGYNVVDVVTFGQPKVTDKDGVELFANLPITRFVNRNDPVPHLPPDDMTPPENFSHFGREVVLYDGPYYAYLVPGDPSYARSTTGNLAQALVQADFNQHGKIYVDRLAEKLNQAIQIPYVVKAPASQPG